jgi:hypothetical protein
MGGGTVAVLGSWWFSGWTWPALINPYRVVALPG